MHTLPQPPSSFETCEVAASHACGFHASTLRFCVLVGFSGCPLHLDPFSFPIYIIFFHAWISFWFFFCFDLLFIFCCVESFFWCRAPSSSCVHALSWTHWIILTVTQVRLLVFLYTRFPWPSFVSSYLTFVTLSYLVALVFVSFLSMALGLLTHLPALCLCIHWASARVFLKCVNATHFNRNGRCKMCRIPAEQRVGVGPLGTEVHAVWGLPKSQIANNTTCFWWKIEVFLLCSLLWCCR